MKKFFALLLALALMLSLSVGAFAVEGRTDPNGATLKINFEYPEGTTNVRTFTAWRILSLEANSDKSNPRYYLAENDDLYGSAHNGEAFRELFTTNASDTVTVGDKTYPVQHLKEGYTETDLVNFLSQNMPDDVRLSEHPERTENMYFFSGSPYVKNQLPAGYYYIEDSLGFEGILLTLFNGDNVEIDPKNVYPYLNLTPARSTADSGAAIDEITVSVSLPETLTEWNLIHVTISPKNLQGDYVVSPKGFTPTAEHGYRIERLSNGSTRIVIPVVDIPEIADYDPVFQQRKIEFTLNGNLIPNPGGDNRLTEAKVNAYLELMESSSSSYVVFKSKTVSSIINTYYIDVFKYTMNGDVKAPLEGAQFSLSKQVPVESGTPKTVYLKINDGTVSWTENVYEAPFFESGADGLTEVLGGLRNGTYTLTEEEAPSGYSKANDQIIVIDDADASAEVENRSESLLPTTGGIGTTMFYLVGGTLMILALVLLMARKRVGIDA